MKKKKERMLPSTNKIYLSIIIIATLFIGIGYAAINSVTFSMGGEIIAVEQEGIFITDVEYVDSQGANLEDSEIININQTNFNSYVSLEDDKEAYITYHITIYNSTNYDYMFEDTRYVKCLDDECTTYTNDNIGFKLTMVQGEEIKSKGYIDFDITFSYVDGNNITETDLTSYLNFFFTEVDKIFLVDGPTLNARIKNSDTYLTLDYSVSKVIFGRYHNYDDLIDWDEYECFVDEDNAGYIRLFRKNIDGETIVYILSERTIYSNPNSGRSFANLRLVSEVVYENFDTSQVLDMTRMFYMYDETVVAGEVTDGTIHYASSLIRLDLTIWDVSNVKTFRAMFGYNTRLQYLDISTWNTSNCENMGYMFQALLTIPELDVSALDTENVVSMEGMFLKVTGLTELDLSYFDTSKVTSTRKMFGTYDQHGTSILYNLKTIYVSDGFNMSSVKDSTDMFAGNYTIVGGNGTKYNENFVTIERALIDTAIYDESGNLVSGQPGYFTRRNR